MKRHLKINIAVVTGIVVAVVTIIVGITISVTPVLFIVILTATLLPYNLGYGSCHQQIDNPTPLPGDLVLSEAMAASAPARKELARMVAVKVPAGTSVECTRIDLTEARLEVAIAVSVFQQRVHMACHTMLEPFKRVIVFKLCLGDGFMRCASMAARTPPPAILVVILAVIALTARLHLVQRGLQATRDAAPLERGQAFFSLLDAVDFVG